MAPIGISFKTLGLPSLLSRLMGNKTFVAAMNDVYLGILSSNLTVLAWIWVELKGRLCPAKRVAKPITVDDGNARITHNGICNHKGSLLCMLNRVFSIS